jgi:hypothetical protein
MSPLCSKDVVQNFLELRLMKAGKPDVEHDYSDENECMNECLSKCNCQAYSYHSSICLQLVSDNVVKLGSAQAVKKNSQLIEINLQFQKILLN